jgi:hypothetical protein
VSDESSQPPKTASPEEILAESDSRSGDVPEEIYEPEYSDDFEEESVAEESSSGVLRSSDDVQA